MRRIDPNRIVPDAAWDATAAAADLAVSRGAAVKTYSTVWGATKTRLNLILPHRLK